MSFEKKPEYEGPLNCSPQEYLMFWVRYVPKGKGKDFMEWGT